MAKLIVSHEDAAVGHFHAIVGLLNLVVYCWRFGLLVSHGDTNVGFGLDASLDILAVCLMVLPNLSSFIFIKHVPLENKGDNVTIWKEYRWHNLIFVLQSTLLLSINVYEMHQGKHSEEEPSPSSLLQYVLLNYKFVVKATIVTIRFVCMALATKYNPQPNGATTTIRGAYKDAPAFVRYGLSYAQFVGTCVILCWEISTAMHFILVAGLQINSFCMTLRKKGKIGTTLFLSIYVWLVGNLIVFGFLPPFLEEPRFLGGGREGNNLLSLLLLDERLKPFYMGWFTFWVRRQGINRFGTWMIGPITTELVFRSLQQVVLHQNPAVLST